MLKQRTLDSRTFSSLIRIQRAETCALSPYSMTLSTLEESVSLRISFRKTTNSTNIWYSSVAQLRCPDKTIKTCTNSG